MPVFASLFTPTGLPRFWQPRHTRQTVPPQSSYTLQRSMLGSSVTYDTDHSPRNSRTDLIGDRDRSIIAAASTESFGSLARDTMMVDREESSTPSETMASWLKLDLGSLALTDSVGDALVTSSPPDDPEVRPIQERLDKAHLGSESHSQAEWPGETAEKKRGNGGASQTGSLVDPFESPAVDAAKSTSSPKPTSSHFRPLTSLKGEHVETARGVFSSARRPATGLEQRAASFDTQSSAMHHLKRYRIRPSTSEEIPRTYLSDGSIKLPKGHPFASSISSLFQDPPHSGPDQGKPLPPGPPLPKLATTMSAFPSDHYPNAMLGRLANDQSMDADDIMNGSFPPKRLVSRHQPSQSVLWFGTQSPSTPRGHDASPNIPSTAQPHRVAPLAEDTPRPRSRNRQFGTIRRPKPPRPSRHRRPPPPPPPTSDSNSASGQSGKKPGKPVSSGDKAMRSPRHYRDSVDLTRARALEGERKPKIPRLSRHARAISLHDEVFPACIPSFPTRSAGRFLVDSPSPQGGQDEVVTPAQRRPNTLAMQHTNSSRLSITLKDLRHPLQRIFRSQSRQTEGQQDQENAAPTPVAPGVDHSGETLFTRPASLHRRPTMSWLRRNKTPQSVYKEGYEPQEHFASIRGCAPPYVSEETIRCRNFPTMDIDVGRQTGMDFVQFKREEAERVALMEQEAKSFKGQLKRKMSQLRSLSWGESEWNF